MATKKSSQQEDLLTHHIQAKVTAKVYQRSEDLRIKNKLLNDKRTRQANTLKKKNCLLLSRRMKYYRQMLKALQNYMAKHEEFYHCTISNDYHMDEKFFTKA